MHKSIKEVDAITYREFFLLEKDGQLDFNKITHSIIYFEECENLSDYIYILSNKTNVDGWM